ncbi:MAG: ISL3 family transposase [Nitrospinota bacterium]
MRETEFFTQILDIKEPWRISKVFLNKAKGRVDIFLEHSPGIAFPCPECEKHSGVYDHMPEREFRHLNTCQLATYIHVRVPRIRCDQHGVRQIMSGLGEENSTTTYEFESHVLDLLHECSVKSVSRLTGFNWHGCWNVLERAVKRGQSRKPHKIPERMGVDEKSFAKGHKYETLVYNIDAGTVEYVCDNRKQESLESYYKQFKEQERKAVKAVAMDMWDPYIAATRAFIPHANKKIVFDRFHVMRHVLEAVDKVRKIEHGILKEQGNEILKGSKYLWLWSIENLPEYRQKEFEELRAKDLKVSRAYGIKENLRHMWAYRREGWMRKFFKKWYQWATHSRLTPMVKAAKTLKRHLDNIVTYAKHRITNALGESMNSKIEKVKRMACGFRNRDHYKTAIYFHCGGLDLYPRRSALQLQIINA